MIQSHGYKQSKFGTCIFGKVWMGKRWKVAVMCELGPVPPIRSIRTYLVRPHPCRVPLVIQELEKSHVYLESTCVT